MSKLESDAIPNSQRTVTYKVGIVNLIYRLFLITTGVMPLASLFWNVNFFWVKANWAPYPIFLFGTILLLFRKRVPIEFVTLIFLTSIYLLLALLNAGETESILRFVVSIMPLTFYFLFHDTALSNHRYFWWIYGTLMVIPIFNSYLQYVGKMPYDEFDYIDDETVGRMSGGFQKPHNLVAYLVPIFLLGFYFWKVKRRTLTGILIVSVVIVGVYMIGYRTSLIAFFTILVSSFFARTTERLVYTYYYYFLNFFVPILAFIFFRVLLSTVGLWDKLRGRVPIWELHSWQFFDQGLIKILLGSQKVMLEPQYQLPKVVLLDEAHNNSFRTIIVFGLLGFFLYCFMMRKIVMHIQNGNYENSLKFIMFSCFTYFIFYTITNEPLYYGSVLWPVMIWIFLVQSMPTKWKVSPNQS